MKTVLAAALALSAAPAFAQADTQAVPYLAQAGMGDVFEITSSQIAVMRSQNPGVKRFATMLIDHHSKTTNATLMAAKDAGVAPPPPVLDARHRTLVGQLYSAADADFDRVYLAQQLPAHQEALALHQGYSDRGDTAQLRTTAKAAVPVVQSHIEQVQALQAGR